MIDVATPRISTTTNERPNNDEIALGSSNDQQTPSTEQNRRAQKFYREKFKKKLGVLEAQVTVQECDDNHTIADIHCLMKLLATTHRPLAVGADGTHGGNRMNRMNRMLEAGGYRAVEYEELGGEEMISREVGMLGGQSRGGRGCGR